MLMQDMEHQMKADSIVLRKAKQSGSKTNRVSSKPRHDKAKVSQQAIQYSSLGLLQTMQKAVQKN